MRCTTSNMALFRDTNLEKTSDSQSHHRALARLLVDLLGAHLLQDYLCMMHFKSATFCGSAPRRPLPVRPGKSHALSSIAWML
jgi:hypothetical protein